MNPRVIWIAAMIVATTGICAQDTTKEALEAPPNPKTPHHKALKQWVGNWKVTAKMDAMPGVPGMEKAIETQGRESASLVCDGLWLKWESEMTCNGQVSTGLWLVGYDPIEKQYISYVVSSDDQCKGLTPLPGKHESDTWTWVGETPQGKMKSVCKFSGPDKLTETLYMIGPDGKEKRFMVMERVRTADAAPSPLVNASLDKKPEVAADRHDAFLQDAGVWDAVVESTCFGETTKGKGTERVQPICGARWTWSEFKTQFQGTPFLGHALVGWDENEAKYVCLWIDSMSANCCLTRGTYDEESKSFTFTGACTGPDGKPMQVRQVASSPGADTRILRMECDSPAMKSTMKITYTRRAKK